MLKRTIVGVLLVGVFVLIWLFGGIVRMAAFAAAALVSVYEMLRLFRTKGYQPCGWPLYLFAAGFYPLGLALSQAWAWLLFGLCVVLVAAERVCNPKRRTEDAMAAMFIMVYPLLSYQYLMLVSCTGDSALEKSALLLTFAGPLMGDTMAYFVGSLLGKHPLCPHLSPKKTVEGSIAGLLGGLLGGVLVFVLQPLYQGSVPLAHLLILGFVCGGVGQIGDLFASSVKRWAQIKDYGNIFPGHGGVMDRLDSVLMCSPVIYLYLYAALGLTMGG